MMHVAEAGQALSAQVIGRDIEFTGVSTDSRHLKAGDLFVALKGDRFDGHAFLEQAAQAGAAAVLVDHPSPSQGLPQIVVDDTTLALGRLGQYWRRKFDLPLVALTGSSGKTTVKEMLAAVLRANVATTANVPDPTAAVLATRGNLNNHIGVPLTLLELRHRHRYAVIEMGMNHAGEIRYLSELAEPDVALINNAGLAHLEHLGSPEAIARAKGEIFTGLSSDGIAVFNADDRFAPLWRELAAQHRQIIFGMDVPAAVSAQYTLQALDSEITFTTPLGSAATRLPAPGLHNVRNALAASAAATALAVPPRTIAAGLAHYQGVQGRLQRKHGVHGVTIIDDSYNANPESVRAAIAVLAQLPGRSWLVLGDMGELGADAPALHAQIGEAARSAGIDRLLALGELSQHAVQAFGAGARHFASVEALLQAIVPELASDVTLLIKGSRFMRMERLIAALTGEAGGLH
jgi:UDP-N-acetylmuramoyl-tripeptide--D-alanyl-D-alanine ligase